MDKDNMEQPFRSSFDFDELESEEWNTPSDDVWENIEDDLTKKKRRFAFWWWLPVAGLSTLLLLIFVNRISKNQENLNKNAYFKQEKAEKKIVQQTENGIEVSANVQKISLLDKNVQTENIKKTSSYVKNSAKLSDNFLPKQEKSTIENTTKVGSIFSENKNSVDTFSKVVSVLEKQNETPIKRVQNKDSIDFLPNLKFSISPTEKNIMIAEVPILIKKPSSAPRFIFSVGANTFGLRNEIKGNVGKFDGESFDYAYSVGASIIKPFKKMFFEVGVDFSQINYKLSYDLALPFNGLGEVQNTNGSFDNTYNGSVPTSLGDLKMEMTLARSSAQVVTQGEQIPISARGSERLSFVQVPISWGRNFAIAPKWNFTGKVTLNNMFNVGSRTQFGEVISHHEGVKETKTQVKISPTPSVWCPLIGTSAELDYVLAKKWTIGANIFAQQSLIPIFKNDNYSNTPYLFGAGTNLKYRF